MNDRLEFIIEAKDQFTKELDGLLGKMSSLPNIAMIAAGAVASTGVALFGLAKSSADAYDEVKDLSERLGITTETISKMNHAAKMNGLTNTDMANSLRFLSVRLGEASIGGELATKAFKSLGVDVRDANGNLKSVDEILPEVADGFQNLDSGAQRAAIAQQLMSEAGTKMVGLLSQGSEGLAELSEEAEKFGLVISDQAGQNASDFNDSIDRMKGAGLGLKNSLAEGLFPVFTAGFNSIANIIADNRKTITSWAGVVVEYTGKGAEIIAYFGGVVADSFRAVHAIWEGSKAAIATLGQIIFEAFSKMADKAADFMEVFNFRGIFDENISRARQFQATWSSIGDSLGTVAKDAAGEVQAYWDGGMGKATEAVKDFVEQFKAGMSETKGAVGGGQETGGGVILGPGAGTGSSGKDDEKAKAAVDKQKQAYDQLVALHEQYTMTEEERLNAWYARQQELFSGNQDALILLDETFQARKDEIRLAKEEQLNAQWESSVLTEEERLMAWYTKQLAMYDGNEAAILQAAQIYGNKKDALTKTQNARALAAKIKFFGDLETITSMFGRRGAALAKTLAITQAMMNAYSAASNALADVRPFPLNIAAAAAAFAQGISQVSQIRSVGQAHAGLSDVPSEGTYILQRGERVLSPRQNEDLTEFIAEMRAQRRQLSIERIDVHILENATDLDALRAIDDIDWQTLVAEKIAPALAG